MKREYTYGYMVYVFVKSGSLDHAIFFDTFDRAAEHVNDYMFEGFIVLSEEARILVPRLLNGFSFDESVDIDTDFNHRDFCENNEVEDGVLSSDDR